MHNAQCTITPTKKLFIHLEKFIMHNSLKKIHNA